MVTGRRKFTVDARLLRELGERLVGRPHIALAELIKNAYDADARTVEIAFDPSRIVVTDDGHGMSPDDFDSKWMRVGTTHKERTRTSPALHRSMTGSKGVGRLAVQLLARKTHLSSVGLIDPEGNSLSNPLHKSVGLHEQIDASINWDEAVESGDLTSVEVPVEIAAPRATFAAGSPHGTRVELTDLVHRWDAVAFRRLAQEIWSLQPPFEVAEDDPNAFNIVFTTRFQKVYERFNRQMNAVLDIWSARITGELRSEGSPTVDPTDPRADLPPTLPTRRTEESLDDEETTELGEVQVDDEGADQTEGAPHRQFPPHPTMWLDVTVELRGQEPRKTTWRVPECQISEVSFDIKVFDLVNRQPEGVKVGTAREYLERFGGVGIYDETFRLPYYGADHDWLDLERSHAARLSTSQLVPASLQVDRGLQDLPTNRRLFGHANVSTTREAQVHSSQSGLDPDALAIQVTRDRLVDNAAYERLRVMIRAALDFYAMEQARTRLTKARSRRMGSGRPPSSSFAEIRSAIRDAKPALPASTFQDLDRAVALAVEEAEALEEISREHAALLGALATAGMTALAYEHEISKQIRTIEDLATDLAGVLDAIPLTARATVGSAVSEMRDWVDRAHGIRNILAGLMDEETRIAKDRFKARTLARKVADQVRVLSAGIPIKTDDVPADLRLPRAALPAWSAVFQNLYLNAFNALIQCDGEPIVNVDGGGSDAKGWVRVQDNGSGVDLADSDRLWEPFERGAKLPPEVAALGLGGTGLGLTIVRMITDELGAHVAFTQPEPGYATAVTISWEGRK
ncbi:ATP-binding protein [Kribbella sp. NPDC003557]|uniref:ATP-binding protein n=1 Tax=Kribbella sp. NPDC003557 TaxID=3154449 RepID=UPI0033BC5B07